MAFQVSELPSFNHPSVPVSVPVPVLILFSGNKLTRLVGWWLLSQRKPASNGLVGFIQEWETAARILEHIYLAYIR
jgi:hypothetical protein